MPDWRAYVRERLPLPDVEPERAHRIVREVAAQLEDCYRDARASGLSEAEAEAVCRNQIPDWSHFADLVHRADRPHVLPRLDRAIDAAPASRTRMGGVPLMFAHL